MITQCETRDGKDWLPGVGNMNADIMFILSAPFPSEVRSRASFSDRGWDSLYDMCKEAGIQMESIYRTYAVKFLPADIKKLKAAELKLGHAMMCEEIETIKPKVVVLFGVDLIKVFFGKGAGIGQFDGATAKSELYPDIDFVCLYQPAYVLRYPASRPAYVDNLRKLAGISAGTVAKIENEYEVITSADRMDEIVDTILFYGGMISLDCEWEGLYPDFPGAFIRTIQFRHRAPESTDEDKKCPERTYIIKLSEASTEYEDIDGDSGQIAKSNPSMLPMEENKVMERLKDLLENPNIEIIGHNVHEDGKWLLMLHGIDIRRTTLYDTMIAEHCLNSMGPFGLEVLTCKYTTLGRYDTPVEQWKLANPKLCEFGYASIPDDLLLPYGAFDVVAPFLILDAQVPLMGKYIERRGEYPSQLQCDMEIARILYELEMTGMLVDQEQLDKLTKIYHDKREELKIPLQAMVMKRYGMADFNPGSHKQMVELLFNHMKLAPIKTTGKPSKTWEWVQRQTPEKQKKYSPSTDSDTLAVLMECGDELLKRLLDYSKVGTICKNFLRDDKTGGIPGCMHPDGRLHARFSQLSETGRFKHSNPNVANFPKAAEGDLGKILLKDADPKLGELLGVDAKGKPIIGVRSVIVADPGHVFVEGDFKTAELVVLGRLSEDDVYLSLLGVEGKDLHDRTTIDSFKLKVWHYDGSPYDMDEMAKIAAEDFKLYEWLLKQLVYEKPNGERLTRAEFKDTMRVAGKATNFSINYGRGSKALQLQVRAEAGLNFPVDLFQAGIDAWHDTYKRASAFLARQGKLGIERHYAENPFGRRRVFAPAANDDEAAACSREAGNAIIQSTVADALILSMIRLEAARKDSGLSFKIINPIHDALMLLAKKEEAKETSELLKQCMSSVIIPGMDGSAPFHLDVDIEVFHRWGTKG